MAGLKMVLLLVLVAVFAPLSIANNILYGGDTLNHGESLTWGSYSLTMQNHCNLVLYDTSSAIWSTGTNGASVNCRLVMQNDGNLVVYSPSNNVIWASNTATGNGGYVCILQRDRNVVIYGGATWASGTNT